MAGERVQFTVSADDGDDVFERLASIQHRSWPSLGPKGSAWSRAALRILYAHAFRPEGTEWFIVRGQKTSKALTVRTPQGTTSFKVDVHLGDADWRRVSALQRAELADSPAAALRTAVHFLSQLAARLAKGGELLIGVPGDSRIAAVELSEIAADEGGAGAEPKLRLRVQGSSVPAPPQSEAPPVYSQEIDAFFSILWVTIAFNRWLATRVDAVTARALSITTEGGASEHTPETLRAILAENERWQRELDLLTLLDTFWDAQRGLMSDRSLLRAELANQRLLPDAFRRRVLELHTQAEIGVNAIRAYLQDRLRSLKPCSLHQGHGGSGDAESRMESPKARWRNWTRSRYAQDGYREIYDPIEWTAVVHHRLRTRRGGRPELVANDLQSLLLDAFGARNSTHVELLAASCARYNQAFKARRDAGVSLDRDVTLRLEAVLDELKPAKVPRESEEALDFARLVFLFLTIARVVQPIYRWRARGETREGASGSLPEQQVDLCVRNLGYADFSEVRARMFGAQVTISGLHWILRGGIVPRARRGRAWLVCGQPGDGKSTFGLALAADAARRGRVAIVVCSDERAEAVRERLDTFGLLDEDRYEVVARDEFERRLVTRFGDERLAHEPTSEPRPAQGLLVIFGDTTQQARTPIATGGRHDLELASWLEHVSERSRSLCRAFAEQEGLQTSAEERAAWRALQRKWRWMAVVIDSIDTLDVEQPSLLNVGGGAREERQALAKLIQSIESSRVWAILLCGHDDPRKLALSYLADTVVELSTTDAGLERRLQIHKCRTQAFDPGQHTLQLVEGSGVAVHPNLPSMQRVARRRNRRHLDSEHVIPLPERILWPGTATAELEGAPTAAPVHRIRRGSTVLLYGPPQSGKGPLLMNLPCQRMQLRRHAHWRLGATGAVLFVSFRLSAEDCLRPLAESHDLGERWRNNVSDLHFHWYGADDTMRASQIAHDLVRFIQRSRRDGIPLDWIIFTGVEALKSNLPAVEAERSFWPTILATTASEEITTAFVVAGSDDRFVAEHRQDMDYVFRFGREEASDRRTVEIEKSVEAPPSGGYPKLLLDLVAGTLTGLARDEASRM